jgi:LytS/YehU family sensor histidine kinase
MTQWRNREEVDSVPFRPGPPPVHGQARLRPNDIPRGGPGMPFRGTMMLNDWLVAILVVGFNVAIRYLFKSMRDERQIRELEALGLQAELNYLKAQINPHFFMNTLNNIHALIDIDAEKAKNSVIELSKIMRYVLYEADMPGIMLAREIQFIENYVSLMRIRFSDEIDIRMDFPNPVPDVRVPPMLLVTLVENAFKHGISYRRDSFIHIGLAVADGRLRYRVDNSVGDMVTGKPGVGMENMKKRLGLIFGEGRYTFTARQTIEKYSVVLEIPLLQ